jgi:hypothetical protein
LPVIAHTIFLHNIEAVKAKYERDGLCEAKTAFGQKLFHLPVPEALRFFLPYAARIQHPAPDDHLRLPHFDWLKKPPDIVGIVLAVRIEGDDDLCSDTQGSTDPCPQRATEPPVQDMAESDHALVGGELTSAVAAAVIDDDEPCETTLLEPPDHLDDGLLFILGGDDDDHSLRHYGYALHCGQPPVLTASSGMNGRRMGGFVAS